jgi:Cu+-exporting ATPase
MVLATGEQIAVSTRLPRAVLTKAKGLQFPRLVDFQSHPGLGLTANVTGAGSSSAITRSLQS